MRQDEALAASLAREKQLESLVKQLRSAIVAKDEMIWRLAVGTPQLPSQTEPTGAPSEAPACSVPTPASAAPTLEPRGSDKWSLRWLSNPPVRAARKRSRAPGATPDEPEATLCRSLPVRRRGTLTKLSKGGFTANWNRRVFVLIGASLFYERDWPQLMMQPKLFVRLKASHMVTAWEDESGTHAHAFALVDGELPAGEENALLLFAADSPHERRLKAAWIDAMTIARADPPCPARLVAQMLSINSLEETQRAVLEAPAHGRGGRRGSAPPAMLASTIPAPVVAARTHAVAESRPRDRGVEALPRLSRRLSEPSSPGVGWLMEKILPDFIKGI